MEDLLNRYKCLSCKQYSHIFADELANSRCKCGSSDWELANSVTTNNISNDGSDIVYDNVDSLDESFDELHRNEEQEKYYIETDKIRRGAI